MASPEAKIHFLGREFDPGKVALGGIFLLMAGIWSANAPCLAIPSIIAGLALVGCGTRKMEQQNR